MDPRPASELDEPAHPSASALARAYLRARGRWTGCDWRTTFGVTQLDLVGMTAAQALLMARATSGPESADWREAVHWLRLVESDAEAAESAALAAVVAAARGDLAGALDHARSACEIEERYHSSLIWGDLQLIVARAQTLAPAGERREPG